MPPATLFTTSTRCPRAASAARTFDRLFALPLSAGPANWQAAPLLPGALVLWLALVLRQRESSANLIAGWVLGIVGRLIWHPAIGFLGAAAAGPLALPGRRPEVRYTPR